MKPQLPRTLVVALAAALLLTNVSARAATSRTLPATSGIGQIVTLVTGERVVLGTSVNGGTTVQVVLAAAEGPAAHLKTVRLNGDTYVIPASAEPYLNRYLDVGLFDVTKLAAASLGDRIPLSITYEPGTSPSLPGVTITSSGAGSATGYVTWSSARVFGAALAEQAIADSQAGWPASSPLFGSVTGIAPDIAIDPAVTPDFPQTTLIIKGISRTGWPIRFGFGTLMNMDDGRKFSGFIFMVRGEARASVPFGTYAAVFDSLNFSSDGSLTVREVVVTDFAVTGSQPAMTIDARLATAAPSVTTPKVSVREDLVTDLVFNDEPGYSGNAWGWDLGPSGARILFTPTPVPTVGTLQMDTRWLTVDPSTPGGRYEFDANFSDAGISADQARRVPAVSHAATVANSYASDRLMRIGGTARFVFLPGEFFAFASFVPTPMPLRRVDYVYAPGGSAIQDLALADVNAWDPGIVMAPFALPTPGSTRTERWFRNPYVLAVPEFSPSDPFAACLACKTRTAMTFAFALNDGDPTHQAWVFGSPNGRPIAYFSVYRDGTLLLREPDSLGDIFAVPPGPATYRVVNRLSRTYTESWLSTFTVTDVTFRSGQGVPAPTSLYCFTGDACSIMPVLTAQLDLHATSFGAIPLGTSTFDLRAGHIDGAAQLPISSVAMEVRRTGSSTWKALQVTGVGPGHYRAIFKAMAWMDQRRFDVRVTVTDTKGGELVRTTDRAFVVGA